MVRKLKIESSVFCAKRYTSSDVAYEIILTLYHQMLREKVFTPADVDLANKMPEKIQPKHPKIMTNVRSHCDSVANQNTRKMMTNMSHCDEPC